MPASSFGSSGQHTRSRSLASGRGTDIVRVAPAPMHSKSHPLMLTLALSKWCVLYLLCMWCGETFDSHGASMPSVSPGIERTSRRRSAADSSVRSVSHPSLSSRHASRPPLRPQNAAESSEPAPKDDANEDLKARVELICGCG
jgi:hypothetical protein